MYNEKTITIFKNFDTKENQLRFCPGFLEPETRDLERLKTRVARFEK